MSSETEAGKVRESGWRETVKIVVHALILAMIVRIFFYQPFNIPSGSMKQTLLVGDYLFVSSWPTAIAVIPFLGASFRSAAASLAASQSAAMSLSSSYRATIPQISSNA